jgi:DNA-binding LacI/PurR family transcriptional regulator
MRITLFTADDHDAEIAQYERLRDGADVDAFVVTSTSYDDPRIEWLARERMPFVAFGRPWGSEHLDDPERMWVDVDGRAGTRMATEHLIARGHRRVGYLGWPAGSGTGDDRRSGWESALATAFDLAPSALSELAIETVESVPKARVAVEQLLKSGAGLEALVCASDSLGLGAMMAVREAGLPHFPVFGFDNTPVAQAVGLSSVDQRLDDVAVGTFELLMGATGRAMLPYGSVDGDDPRHRLITPQLVVRRSSHLEPVEEAGGTTSGDDHRKEHQS